MTTKTLKKQTGFTIFELLTTLAIFAILASAAVPSITGTFATNEINSASKTLVQSIKMAKDIAYAESTFVDVAIDNNIITIKKLNTGTTRTVTLPSGTQASVSTKFRFNTIGNVLLFPESAESPMITANSATNIQLKTKMLSKTISISSSGRVTSTGLSNSL